MSRLASIAVHQVTCDFPGARALTDLSLEFLGPRDPCAGGEENGAGKCTLLKVLSGLVTPTRGQIVIGDGRVSQARHAFSQGIRTIPQGAVPAPDLSIAENLLMGKLPRKPFGRVDWGAVFERTGKKLLQKVGLDHLPPERLVAGLELAEQQQLLEVARALADEGNIYLFDEPTSSLSSAEVTKLGEILTELRAAGKIVLYVSHRLDEIFSYCDQVSVLRDGALVASKPVSGTSSEELIRLMVGREIPFPKPARLPRLRNLA